MITFNSGMRRIAAKRETRFCRTHGEADRGPALHAPRYYENRNILPEKKAFLFFGGEYGKF
jgi:hypothetical protein